jgi:uncharacterized membrane protein
LVDHYTRLNDAIGDLQTSMIVEHEFLYGERVPDADEVEADEAAAKAEADALAEAEALAKEKEERAKQYAQMKGEAVDEEETDDPFAVEEEETEEEEEEDEAAASDYNFTKYTTTKGSIVRVGYEGDVDFLLNYNSFDVTVQYDGKTYTIEALGFVRID